jgi:ADP-heptose:LPS heptosyltransferase
LIRLENLAAGAPTLFDGDAIFTKSEKSFGLPGHFWFNLPMLRRNLLIFHSAALGDFILTWPLAMALSRLYPQSRTIYVTQRQKGLLAETVLNVESVDGEQGWHHLYSEQPTLPDTVAKMLAGTRHALTFNAVAGDLWTSNVLAAMSAGALPPDQAATAAAAPPAAPGAEIEITHLPTKPPAGFAGSHGEFLAASLAGQPAIQSAFSQLLASIASRGLAPGRLIGDSIVIHPGAGSPVKCWPIDRYIELVRRLRATGRKVTVALGEVEIENLPPQAMEDLQRDAEVVRPGSYLELFNLLRGARGFIGNDAGPSHLAGILGVPTIAIFGPSDPRIWKPIGPAVEVLHEPDLNNLPVDRVLELAVAKL